MDAGLDHVKFVLPTASVAFTFLFTRYVSFVDNRPMKYISANDGMRANSWFNVFSFDVPNRPEDQCGMYKAVGWINKIISKELEEVPNVPSWSIAVGGHSQGGVLALLTVLTSKRPLAGLFALATYVPLRAKTPEIMTRNAKMTPIFWAHGMEDAQVNYTFARSSAQTLSSELGVSFIPVTNASKLGKQDILQNGGRGLRFHTYVVLNHSLGGQTLEDLGIWLSAVTGDNRSPWLSLK